MNKCSVVGCESPVLFVCHGLCRLHLDRSKKYGDPNLKRGFGDAPQIFIEEIIKKYNGASCLTWPFARDRKGYARHSGANLPRIICIDRNGPPPSKEHHAAHSCGNGMKGCCNPWHLRWATPTENNADRAEHGTLPIGEKCWSAKLTEADVLKIKNRGESLSVLAKEFGVSVSGIHDIKSGRTWSRVTGLVYGPKGSASVRSAAE